MDTSTPLPKYRNDLASFVGDLRSSVFASQSKIARYLQLSHTTISRYENGHLLPPSGYVAHLAYLMDERLSKSNGYDTQRQNWLLAEVNEALRWNYSDALLFTDWNELKQVAQSYFYPQSDERRPYSIQSRRVDWGEAPDVSAFYGRDSELSQLKNWVVSARCRLIIIAGMSGIGKTTSVTRLAHEVEPSFKHIIWRSLRNAPALEHTVQELSASLLAGGSANPSQSLDQQILRLLEFMQAHRCLIVLDNLESLMGTGDRIGVYRPGHEDYRVFLQTIATTQHQSCLLITSREIPAEFSSLTEEQSAVRLYNLSGLPVAAAEKILAARGIMGSPASLSELNRLYSGNPMALRLVSETISSFFGGDVDGFLGSETTVFNDIRYLMDQSFERLAVLSHEVLFWLAIKRQPLALDQLANLLVPRRAIGNLIDVLQSLHRCSLIERIDDRFYLPNVVSEYVIDRLIRQIHQEVTRADLHTLHRIPLLTTDSTDDVRQTQMRLIVKPLAHLLISEFGDQHVRAKFEQWVSLLRAPAYATAGFAPGNLLNIMHCSGHEIRNYDFSELTIQHAFMANVSLTEVDFSHASLVSCLFDNTFVGINTVAVSKRAQFLALASGNEIRVWRLSDRQPYRILRGHHDMVWSLIFAQDEQHVFSRDANNTVHRWNIEDSRIELTIYHPTTLFALAVSHDATIIATGGDEGVIYLWHGQTGQLQHTLKGTMKTAIRALAIDSSQQLLAAGGSDGSIALWDLTLGKQIAVLDGHEQAVTSLLFIRNDKILISSAVDGTIKIWNMDTLNIHVTLSGHGDIVSAVKASSDGEMLASSSYDRTVKIWDMANQEPKYVLQGHDMPVSAIDLDETGSILVSGSYDRTVRIWDARDGHLIDLIRGLTFEFRSLAFSADSQFIAAGSSDYHIYVWDIKSGTRIQTCRGHERWVESVAFHPKSNLLATGSYDRTVRIWNLQSSRELAVLKDHKHWVVCVCFSSDGKLLAAGSVDQTIRLWNLDTYESVRTLRGHESTVNCIAFHPHQPLLASSSRDKTTRLWDIENGALIKTLPMPSALVAALCFSADGHVLTCVTQDGRMMSWDVMEGKIVDEWRFSAEPVHIMAFSADGQMLACHGPGRAVTLWDVLSRQKRQELQTNGGKISSLVFDRQAQRLASGSMDGWGKVWDVQTGRSMRTFKVDRPYEGMNITETTGINAAQREMLKSLGAVEHRASNT